MVSAMANLAAAIDAARVTLLPFDSNLPGDTGNGRLTRLLARLKFWRRWWRLLGEFAPHAVHIHTCSGFSYFLDVALLLLARAAAYASCCMSMAGASIASSMSSDHWVAHWHAGRARSAVAVLVVSQNWQTLLAPRLPGARVIVIENAVVLPQPLPARVATPAPVFLFLGLVTPEKGIADLLAARGEARHAGGDRDRWPTPDAPFLARMQALASSLPAEHQREIRGRTGFRAENRTGGRAPAASCCPRIWRHCRSRCWRPWPRQYRCWPRVSARCRR